MLRAHAWQSFRVVLRALSPGEDFFEGRAGTTQRPGSARHRQGSAAFLKAGYTLGQVLEVILGIAFKTMSNFTNQVADTLIDKQFAPFTWEPAGRAHSAV